MLAVGPPGEVQAEQGDYVSALKDALETLPPAKAAKDIAKRFGVDRAEVYERAMALKSGA